MPDWNKARVLITGAGGFVGSHLVRRLVGEGAKVHVFLHRKQAAWRLDDVCDQLIVHRGDLERASDVRVCVREAQPQFVFNVAGMRERGRGAEMIEPSLAVNLLGVTHLCTAVLDEKLALRAFVHTGSGEEYGNGPVPFRESQREQPVSPYSASKAAATHFCQMLHRSSRLPIVILRPCLLYGPAQEPDFLIPNLIQHCLTRRDKFPMTAGMQTRDLAHVSDMVEAFLLAARSEKAIGEVINISGGRGHRIKDIAAKIVKLVGNPIALEVGRLPARHLEIPRLVCSNAKAKKLLGWTPQVSLDQGLRETIAWYRFSLGAEGQRDRGAEGQRGRGAEGQRGRGTEGQRDRGTEGQRDRGTEGAEGGRGTEG